MATITKPIPHELLRYIPHYDGTSHKLHQFISTCEDLSIGYCADNIQEKEANHWILFKAAMCKLEGPAEAVAFNNSCSSIKDLIKSLKQNFADNRSVPELIAELTVMKSYQREHPIEFLNRLNEKRTNVITKYKLDGVTGLLLENLICQLNATLVNTFVHGVHPTLGSHLQVLQVQDLDDARNKLINDCSIVLQQLRYKTTIETMNRVDSRKHSNNTTTFRNPNYEQNFQKQWSHDNSFEQTHRPFQSRQQFSPHNVQQTNFPQNFQQNFSNQSFQKQNYRPNFQQQRFPQQSFQQQNSNFKPNTQVSSSNTVSMRTQRTDPVQKLKTYRSPYEVNYLEEEPEDNYNQSPIEAMQCQINTLTESLNKLTNHFLESGPQFSEDPPSDST